MRCSVLGLAGAEFGVPGDVPGLGRERGGRAMEAAVEGGVGLSGCVLDPVDEVVVVVAVGAVERVLGDTEQSCEQPVVDRSAFVAAAADARVERYPASVGEVFFDHQAGGFARGAAWVGREAATNLFGVGDVGAEDVDDEPARSDHPSPGVEREWGRCVLGGVTVDEPWWWSAFERVERQPTAGEGGVEVVEVSQHLEISASGSRRQGAPAWSVGAVGQIGAESSDVVVREVAG